MPLRTLQQATHVRTANWIGAVQHDQSEMLEHCWPIHRFVDKLPHAMLPTRKLGTALITAQVMIERNDRWLVVPEQCEELRRVTRQQPVTRRWCALVIEEDIRIRHVDLARAQRSRSKALLQHSAALGNQSIADYDN